MFPSRSTTGACSIDADDLGMHVRIDAEVRREVRECLLPEAILLLVPSRTKRPNSEKPDRGAARGPAHWATVTPCSSSAENVIQPANTWPCGVINVKDSSSAYMTITPVESLMPPADRCLDERHFTWFDPL